MIYELNSIQSNSIEFYSIPFNSEGSLNHPSSIQTQPSHLLSLSLSPSPSLAVMLDHLALSVPQDKYDAVLEFYLSALAPLGYETIISMFDGKLVGLGSKNSLLPNKADFWLSGLGETKVDTRYAHWAFVAEGRTHIYTGQQFWTQLTIS